jgi:hypothetical protein
MCSAGLAAELAMSTTVTDSRDCLLYSRDDWKPSTVHATALTAPASYQPRWKAVTKSALPAGWPGNSIRICRVARVFVLILIVVRCTQFRHSKLS